MKLRQINPEPSQRKRPVNTSSRQSRPAGGRRGVPARGKVCPLCGSKIEAGNRFCLNCGADMGSQSSITESTNALAYDEDAFTDPAQEYAPNTVSRRSSSTSRASRTSGTGRTRSTGNRTTATRRPSGNNEISELFNGIFNNGQSKPLVIIGAALCGILLFIFAITGIASSGDSKVEEATEATSEAASIEAEAVDERTFTDVEEEVPEQHSESVITAQNENTDVTAAESAADSTAAVSDTANSTDTNAADSSTETEKKTADEKVFVIADSVRVRPRPSTEGEPIATLSKGTELYRYEKMDDGWSRVDYNDQEAYVKSEFLGTESEYAATKKQEENQANAVEETAETAAATTDTTQQATTDNTVDAAAALAAATAATAASTTNAASSGGASNDNSNNSPASGGAYIVNATNGKVHNAGCHTLPKEGNRLYFNSLAEVQKAGYTDYCGNCMR